MNDDGAIDSVFDALWARVVDRWDDDKAHAAVLEHALRSKMLPELAGRYRAISNDSTRAPVATRQLDRIVVAATEMLMSMKTPAPGKIPLPITLSAFGVCVLLLAWLAFAVWGRH
jgi:hypothetical protein